MLPVTICHFIKDYQHRKKIRCAAVIKSQCLCLSCSPQAQFKCPDTFSSDNEEDMLAKLGRPFSDYEEQVLTAKAGGVTAGDKQHSWIFPSKLIHSLCQMW